MKQKFLIFVTMLASVMCFSILSLSVEFIISNHTESAITYEVASIPMSARCVEQVSYDTIEEYNRLSCMSQSYGNYAETCNNTVQVASTSMKSNSGSIIVTDEVEIDAERLASIYQDEYESVDWDDKNKLNTLSVIWDFLVYQQDVNPMNAAAVLGNVMAEGDFLQEQGTHNIISSMEGVRATLGKGYKGYGIVQWTFSSRQKALLYYYEEAYKLYPDDWDKVKIIAECSMLYEELKAYNVFPDMEHAKSIEDSTGRVCVIYEGFSDSTSAWSLVDDTYVLNKQSGNSYKRYQYALNIYNYFMEQL